LTLLRTNCVYLPAPENEPTRHARKDDAEPGQYINYGRLKNGPERYRVLNLSDWLHVAQLGSEYLVSKKSQSELRAITKEIADLRKKLAALEARKTALEREIKT
jgi:hypothetical protein